MTSVKQTKKEGVISGHLMRIRTTRVLTVRPDHNFFRQKWCIFVLLQRKQLIWEPGSVVGTMWLTTKMSVLRMRIDVHQQRGSEV